jgi:hypothetical protein
LPPLNVPPLKSFINSLPGWPKTDLHQLAIPLQVDSFIERVDYPEIILEPYTL